jgi:predicted MPP superfamily phosphohydrolase
VYLAWLKLFLFPSHKIKLVIISLLLFFAYGFFISMILNRIFNFGLLHITYKIFAFWYGLLVYFFLASVCVLILKALIDFMHYPLTHNSFVAIAASFYVIALFYTLFGLYSAWNPVITQIQVPVKNLPTAWQNKKIIQISDAHIGGSLNQGFLKKLIAKVNSLEPDLILITGDLLDGSAFEAERYITDLKKFKAKRGVYCISGNHEVYFGLEKALAIFKDAGFNIIDNTYVSVDGLQLVGVGFPDFYKRKQQKVTLANLEKYNPNLPSIVLYHTPTDIAEVLNGDTINHANLYLKAKSKFEYAMKMGFSIQLSGHTHHGQMFPFNFVTKYIYNGFDYGLNKLGDFYIYTSSGAGVWGPPIRTFSKSEIVVIKLI